MGDWGGGAEGALGGAGTGAAVGSVVPGVGTAIGAGVGALAGGLAGFFGNDDQDKQRQMIQDYYDSVKNRQAPQAGPAAQSSYSDFRGNQQALVGRLEAMANGQGPSLAAQQFQAATDRNNASQMAMANSGRGGPLSQFTAANNMATMGSQTAQNAGMARTQEELGAISQLGGVIGQGRSADEANNQFNAGQTNQMSQSNLEAQLRTMGYNDSAIQAILGANQQNNQTPSTGDRLLAGGASAFAQYASHGGAYGGAAGGAGYGTPQTGPVTSPGGTSLFGQYSRPDGP